MPAPSQYAVLGPLTGGVEERAFLGCEVIDGRVRPDAPVVVAWLPEDVANDERLVAKLQRETAIVSEFRHPNLYGVRALECFDDGWARVLAYVDGEPLSGLVAALKDKGRLIDPRLAALIMLNACDGVRFAHEEGQARFAGRPIVHGAIRPDTLFVAFEGSTMLSGLGVAGIIPNPAPNLRGYLAPEQMVGGKATAIPSTDVYGLGAVLYELLSGTPPFIDAVDIERAVLTSEPSAIHAGGLVGRLAQVAARAMQKRGSDRFESVAVMRDAVMDALESAPLPRHGELAALAEELIPPSSPQRMRRRTLLAAASDAGTMAVLSSALKPAILDPGVLSAALSSSSASGGISEPATPNTEREHTVVEARVRSESAVDPAEILSRDEPTVIAPMPGGLPELPFVFEDPAEPQREPTGEVTGRQILDERPIASEATDAPRAQDRAARAISHATEPMMRAIGRQPVSPASDAAPTLIMATAALPDVESPATRANDSEAPLARSTPPAGLAAEAVSVSDRSGSASIDRAVPEGAHAPMPTIESPVPEGARAPMPTIQTTVPEGSHASMPTIESPVPEGARAPMPTIQAAVPDEAAALSAAPPPASMGAEASMMPREVAGTQAPRSAVDGSAQALTSSAPESASHSGRAPEPASEASASESRVAPERAIFEAPAPVPKSPMREESAITAFDRSVGDSSKGVLIGIVAAAAVALIGVFVFSEPPPQMREAGKAESWVAIPKDLLRDRLERAGTIAPSAGEAPPEGSAGEEHAPSAVPDEPGRLDLATEPPVDVYFGNEPLGRTPFIAKLPSGTQKLRFTDKATGINVYRTIRIPPNDVMKETITFGSTELAVDAPVGALIFLNGRPLGKAPLQPVKLYEGEYHLKVSLGGQSWAELFEAHADQRIELKAKLR